MIGKAIEAGTQLRRHPILGKDQGVQTAAAEVPELLISGIKDTGQIQSAMEQLPSIITRDQGIADTKVEQEETVQEAVIGADRIHMATEADGFHQFHRVLALDQDISMKNPTMRRQGKGFGRS